ncbi:hypothetical protein [Gordonia terrae]|uniref:hypothetical protein n=1 Tax=Gordonia terrae TaxID=2055 RepID=UPI003F6B9C72
MVSDRRALSRVSPVSKKRRPKKRGTPRRTDREVVADHLAPIVSMMRALRTEVDPLGSEAYTSQLLSALMTRDEPDADEAVVLGFIETVADRGGPECLALSRALSVVATTARTRHAAAEVADRIAARGAAEPVWHEELGRTRLLGCHEYADVFGDECVLMCAFTGPVRPHALIGFLNMSHPHGFLTDIILTTAIDKAIAGFDRRATDLDGLARCGPANDAQVVDTLATALAESHRCVDVPDDVVELRPLLGARLAGCEKRSAATGADDNGQAAAFDALIAGTTDPDRLRVLDAWRDFSAEFDAGRSARLSPNKIRAFARHLGEAPGQAGQAISSLITIHDQTNPWTSRAREALVGSISEVFPVRERIFLDTSWIDEISAG